MCLLTLLALRDARKLTCPEVPMPVEALVRAPSLRRMESNVGWNDGGFAK